MGKPAAALAATIVASLFSVAPSIAKPCAKRQCTTATLAVATVSPSQGSVLTGVVAWQAAVTSGSAIGVAFLVDGTQVASDATSPYSAQLDTRALGNGAHTLTARAVSTTGNTVSSSVGVDVENAAPAAFSPDRHVYCFGDPAYGTSGFVSDGTSGSWIRQYPQGFPQRVSFDDSATLGQILGCRTLRNHLEPTDLSTNGATDVQRADVYTSDTLLARDNEPDLRARRGETAYYGFAFRTGTDFPVKPYPNWQVLWDFHHGGIACAAACWINQQAIEFDLATQKSSTPSCSSAPTAFADGQPHIVISVNGGNSDNPNWASPTSSDTTCLRFAGPAFVPGHAYRVAMKVTWGDHRAGALQVWIDGVEYAAATGIDDMVYSAATGSQGSVYPKFANYRKYDPTYPPTDVWFGGLVRGSTAADVAIP